MNRRLFLGAITGAIADPERLLWIPGRKLISIPAPVRMEDFSIAPYVPKGFFYFRPQDFERALQILERNRKLTDYIQYFVRPGS